MPNLTGKMLGKVRVDMFLARGGMAEVYIGVHTTLQRSVAIKFLKSDLQAEPELRERFEREARVIAMLRHPNIVQVFDFDTHENQPYLVMEYVPGTSLSSYLRELHKNNQRLDLAQVNSLLGKVANALTYAHDNNVIHRDVKPGNILLTSRSTPVSTEKPLPEDVEPILTDFGLVRFTQSNVQTSTGVITGTPAYMSPEQARGNHIDSRTDVYSLGITVYEMLAGRVPFDSDSTLGLLHMQIHDPPPPIEGISEDLQEVIDRALAKDPDERFQTPLEFAEAFDAVLNGTTEAETVVFPSAFSRVATATRQNIQAVVSNKKTLTVPILIGITAVIVVAVAVFLFRMQSSTVLGTSGADPIGVLRFQDGAAEADQVTFSSNNMPLPPEGSQYEAWLIQDDNEHRISIGVIQFDSENYDTLTYIDTRGQNLITLYHGLEITIEPDPDNSPNPSNDVAYSATLPPTGYMHVRHLLSAFDSTPKHTPFIRGLRADTDTLNNLSTQMLASLDSGDEASVRLQAEEMLNLIVGTKSEDYKDWNKDGKIDDPSDGFGLLLNEDNVGYIQGTYMHADLSLTSPDATANMKLHGEHVKIAANNVSDWTPQLRDQLMDVLAAPSLPEAEGSIRQSVALANLILNGIDINGNEKIEPIPGEGGVLTAYEHSYYMADIILEP